MPPQDPKPTETPAKPTTPTAPTPSEGALTIARTTALADESGPGRQNIFNALAMLLEGMNTGLRQGETSKEPPRWVRICRAGPTAAEAKLVGPAVSGGVRGLVELVYMLAALRLEAHKYLDQIDAGKALASVGIEIIKVAATPEFAKEISATFGTDFDNPLSGVREPLQTAQQVISKLPSNEDLDRLDDALFKLLVIDSENDKTGPIRLIQWAYAKKVKLHEATEETFCFLGADIGVSGPRIVKWGDARVFELDFNKTAGDKTTERRIPANNKEVDLALARLKYTDSDLKAKLKAFQKANGLLESGEQDLATVNRLFNLDVKTGRLAAAIASPG